MSLSKKVPETQEGDKEEWQEVFEAESVAEDVQSFADMSFDHFDGNIQLSSNLSIFLVFKPA
jgi:hypothetical protein